MPGQSLFVVCAVVTRLGIQRTPSASEYFIRKTGKGGTVS